MLAVCWNNILNVRLLGSHHSHVLHGKSSFCNAPEAYFNDLWPGVVQYSHFESTPASLVRLDYAAQHSPRAPAYSANCVLGVGCVDSLHCLSKLSVQYSLRCVRHRSENSDNRRIPMDVHTSLSSSVRGLRGDVA